MTRLSVVMSVYNGAATLTETLDSIFAQTESDFELIVIDDGSTDATPQLLAACRDARLRVITQPNAGLTRALIRGCAEARAEFIARHDCGDRSHPTRFAKQLAAFEGDVVLVSCATVTLGPGGERLYVARGDGDTVRASLRSAPLESIQGLSHHGSAMFRRDAYVKAGGYRPQFYFAQDLDLWIRLAALGDIRFLAEELYEARLTLGAISWTHRDEQIALTRLMLAMRDDPSQTDALLARAAEIRPTPRTKNVEARALYFVA
ncbi:MAG TPA: glycosyltransferase, partial [Thermoanaerobaculia bacterium]|nr:glycosyltransferase [Thermoanaerobaculia bacterium]